MERTRRRPERAEKKAVVAAERPLNMLSAKHAEALAGENFEVAETALAEVEKVAEIRNQLNSRKFTSFYKVFEELDLLQKSALSAQAKELKREELIETAEDRATKFSPRVADLYLAIIAHLRGRPAACRYPQNQVKFEDLLTSGDLDLLTSGGSWEHKLNRLDTRFEDLLAGRRALDLREGHTMSDEVRESRQVKLANKPSSPPGRSNESKPSMDEMERLKEGERAPAHWKISPAHGGYFREQSFSVWDADRNTWTEPDGVFSDVVLVTDKEQESGAGSEFTISAEIMANTWTNVPATYTHALKGVECMGDYSLQADQNGDALIMVKGRGKVLVTVTLAKVRNKRYGPFESAAIKVPKMPAQLSAETMAVLEQIAASGQSDLKKAQEIGRFVRRHLTYSNDSSYNEKYENFPDGYFAGIDQLRQADCDVGNTYFPALCAQLKIPTRHVVGHSVPANGTSTTQIDSGTGHAWTEVWDAPNRKWVRVDATSAGDPNLTEENNQSEGVPTPGDYGEKEVQEITDQELDELKQKLQEKKQLLSYTKEERSLAKSAEIELREAREIVKEIAVAESTRLPNGKRIVDVLSQLFNAIVETRKSIGQHEVGPVRKREGGERIIDLVRHKIAVQAKDFDASTRERVEEVFEDEVSFGGFDVYVIGDKSGSMQGYNDGESLQVLQRRAEYLIFSALHKFERDLERAGLPTEQALSVRTQGISFRGSNHDEIDLDKPLSGKFSAADKVKLWHSLGRTGGGNGDAAALDYVYTQIKSEQESALGQATNRLRMVVACSDGHPDDPAQVKAYAKAIGKLGAVVVGIGLTETAKGVPLIYDTPYSRGDIALNLDDLPAIVAKHLVAEAIKLFPAQSRAGAQAMITGVLAQFK